MSGLADVTIIPIGLVLIPAYKLLHQEIDQILQGIVMLPSVSPQIVRCWTAMLIWRGLLSICSAAGSVGWVEYQILLTVEMKVG